MQIQKKLVGCWSHRTRLHFRIQDQFSSSTKGLRLQPQSAWIGSKGLKQQDDSEQGGGSAPGPSTSLCRWDALRIKVNRWSRCCCCSRPVTSHTNCLFLRYSLLRAMLSLLASLCTIMGLVVAGQWLWGVFCVTSAIFFLHPTLPASAMPPSPASFPFLSFSVLQAIKTLLLPWVLKQTVRAGTRQVTL